MKVADIIEEVEKLRPVDRKRLMSHLVQRRLQENHQYRQKLADRFKDKSPENWIGLDELKSKLRK